MARKGGGRLLDMAVERVLPDAPRSPVASAPEPSPEASAAHPVRKTVAGAIAGVALAKIATRSVPGAIIAGGAMLAKQRYDRRHGHKPS